MSQNDLPSQLKKWLNQEMQQHAFGASFKVSDTDDLKRLFVGPNAAVWKWVISHVKSTQTVRNIKGNLALKQKTSGKATYKVKYGNTSDTYDDTIGELLKRRAELEGEITSTLRDEALLEHDILRLSREITDKEISYQEKIALINSVRRKTRLTDAYSGQTEYKAAQYREYQKCIYEKVNSIKDQALKPKGEEKLFSKETKDTGSQSEDESSALETASTKKIRECCQNIGDFLNNASKGAFHGDKNTFDRRKEPLWNQVGEVSNELSPDQVLVSLQSNVRNTTTMLKEMISKVDIRRDAKHLRFKFEGYGEIQDLSSPPPLLRSVNQLVQERTKEHLLRYIEFQKYKNESLHLEEVMVKVKGQINRYLSPLAKKGADMSLIRSLLEVETELDGYRAGLKSLTDESDRMRALVERGMKQRQEIYTKHRKIHEFKELTDKKQTLIQILVKQNMNAQSRIDDQVSEIEDYVNRSLRSHEQQICVVSDKLEHCVRVETTEFANLALPYLMFSQIDNALKTAVMDLSINKMSMPNIQPPLLAVLQCLKFPQFQGSEMLLKKCLELKNEIEESVYKIDMEKKLTHQNEQVGDGNINVTIRELCEQVKEEDRKQLERLLPVLHQRTAKTRDSLAGCTEAKNTAANWWDQPSQHCVPWILVDGHTLQQYLDRWTILATRLRQFIVT